MAKNWDYAELSKLAKLNGGPEAYLEKLNKYGIQKGILMMVPICIGSCILTHLKGDQIVQYFKEKLKLVSRKEALEAKEELLENMDLYQEACLVQCICPNCGKTAKGIDEVLVLFGFERTEDGLQPRAICRECQEMQEAAIVE